MIGVDNGVQEDPMVSIDLEAVKAVNLTRSEATASQIADQLAAALRQLCPEQPTEVTEDLKAKLKLTNGWVGVMIDRKSF